MTYTVSLRCVNTCVKRCLTGAYLNRDVGSAPLTLCIVLLLEIWLFATALWYTNYSYKIDIIVSREMIYQKKVYGGFDGHRIALDYRQVLKSGRMFCE